MTPALQICVHTHPQIHPLHKDEYGRSIARAISNAGYDEARQIHNSFKSNAKIVLIQSHKLLVKHHRGTRKASVEYEGWTQNTGMRERMTVIPANDTAVPFAKVIE